MLKYGTFSVFFIFIAQAALSQDAQSLGLPALSSSLNDNGEMQYSLSLQVLALMTAITLIPSLILGMSSFTRIIIVLSILAGFGDAADSAQPSFDSNSAVSVILYYGTHFEPYL